MRGWRRLRVWVRQVRRNGTAGEFREVWSSRGIETASAVPLRGWEERYPLPHAPIPIWVAGEDEDLETVGLGGEDVEDALGSA
ncbi:MAG: hypothetical protein J6386_06275 [Candidatus Synoicihabitans palmerolidicus]|nr:hypothetical protein [Candidatus Synoicihabitans palmerolidicus]